MNLISKKMKLNKFYILFCLIIPLSAQLTLVAIGGVTETINSADLISGAGSDLTSTFESSATAVSIDLTGTSGSAWMVQVKCTDGTWATGLEVAVKRTSDGSGSGSISDGTTYQTITDSYVDLFSGHADRSIIKLQIRLTGVSVSKGADTFDNNISFKIIPNTLMNYTSTPKREFSFSKKTNFIPISKTFTNKKKSKK